VICEVEKEDGEDQEIKKQDKHQLIKTGKNH